MAARTWAPTRGLSRRGRGVAIVLAAWWILGRLIHTSSKAADPIDITKLSFTVAGGVGAAVALVVAYRRQRDIEQGRFVERFGAAAAQLGDHDVAVRIAGVYAMAGVADESTGVRRQQCIDVLCGYLRLPYSPEFGSNHQSKLVLTEPRTGEDGSPLGQQERHLEYRQNDKEVRVTIVRVIADHLRDHEHSWSACDFDFRTAHLEDVDLRHAVFGGTTRFDEATFSGLAGFDRTTFSGLAGFDRTTFSGPTSFPKATFSGPTSFQGATFSGPRRVQRGDVLRPRRVQPGDVLRHRRVQRGDVLRRRLVRRGDVLRPRHIRRDRLRERSNIVRKSSTMGATCTDVRLGR